VLARREAVGSISGYASLRLAVASQLGQSRLAEARSHTESARVRLALLLQLDPKTLRVGSMLPFWKALPDSGSKERVAPRQALQHARASQDRAAQAEQDADLAWIPQLELGGGVKRARDLGIDYGYVVGVALSLPLFDHGQALKAEAQAQRTLATARSEAMSRGLWIDLLTATELYWAARRELQRFESETAGPVEALLVAAKSGYNEGQRTIVELLDAERARTEVAERRLSLLGKAKRAEARLRSARGEFE
jgi:outer membrane protein TolC